MGRFWMDSRRRDTTNNMVNKRVDHSISHSLLSTLGLLDLEWDWRWFFGATGPGMGEHGFLSLRRRVPGIGGQGWPGCAPFHSGHVLVPCLTSPHLHQSKSNKKQRSCAPSASPLGRGLRDIFARSPRAMCCTRRRGARARNSPPAGHGRPSRFRCPGERWWVRSGGP